MSALAGPLQRLEGRGSVSLMPFTLAEFEALGIGPEAPDGGPVPVERVRGDTQGGSDSELAEAMRGLVGRGVLDVPAAPELAAIPRGAPIRWEPRGDLAFILELERNASAVVFVQQRNSRSVLFRCQTASGPGFLEQHTHVPTRGYLFTLRTLDDATATLLALADPGGRASGGGPPFSELQQSVDRRLDRALVTLHDGATRLEAASIRPEDAGRVTTLLGIVPRRDGVWVVGARRGPSPLPLCSARVSREGLSRCIRSLICDEKAPSEVAA